MPELDDQRLREAWRELTGMRLDDDAGKVLELALRERLGNQGADSASDLGALCKQTIASELAALADDVTVRETFFYRHPQQWHALADHLRRSLPGPGSDASARPVRAWSAGCASGEEAFTLAAVLREALPAAWPVSVLGTDISGEAIAAARRAEYPARAFRAAPGELIGRYFERCHGRLAPVPRLRRMVEFRWHNLMEPLEAQGPFDVVFCRNVLIYLDPAARTVAVDHVRRALRPDGIAFFGPADLLTGAEGLRPTTIGDVLAFQAAPRPALSTEATPVTRRPDPAVSHAQLRGAQPARPPTPDIDPLWREAEAALAAGNRLRATGLLETIQAHDPNHLESRLEQVLILADCGAVEHALELSGALLAMPGATADAYAAAGIVHDAAGDPKRAIELLERAVAMDESFAEAYVLLAALKGLIGEPHDRARALEAARRALGGKTRRDESRRLRRFAAGFSAASLHETVAQQVGPVDSNVGVT